VLALKGTVLRANEGKSADWNSQHQGEGTESMEELLIRVGDMLNDTAYERFTSGLLNQKQFAEVCSTLIEWSHTSERLLNLLQPLSAENGDVSHLRSKSLVPAICTKCSFG
jgi:hypothetical protein